MPGRDYLLRQIEQLTSVLSTILGLKQEQKPKLAMQTIDEFLKGEFGLSSKLLNSLHVQELVRMCSLDTLAGRDKLYTLATLLKEDGELQRMAGYETAGNERSLKSLHLMLAYAALPDEEHVSQAVNSIESLLLQLHDYEIPLDTSLGLLGYLERTGQYANAENVLFDALERISELDDNELVHWIAKGNAFYERLLALDDKQLLQGNLPRQEIYDGIEELDRLTKAVT